MTDLSPADKISAARALFELHGSVLAADPHIGRLIEDYRGAIERTSRLMNQMGVGSACGACAEEGPGSCCFDGIEGGYDPVLLLVNLLMGCAIPDAAEMADSCFFVGDKGCKLIARYYFCLNYFCPSLQDLLGPHRIQELLAAVGHELSRGWELEQALRMRLQS